MNVTLTVMAGPHSGSSFVFEQHSTFLAGRSKTAHFQFPEDQYFSRQHFLVEVNPPRVRVLDLNSRNGIAVNGQRVKVADLNDGDELKAGHTIFRVSIAQPAPDLQQTVDLPAADELPESLDLPEAEELPDAEDQPQTLDLLATAPRIEVPTDLQTDLPTIPGYTIESEIGRGAMGVVYRAARTRDGAPAAVKVILPAAGVPQVARKRFLREARVLGALEHPNIVCSFGNGDSRGLLWLAMERVTGPDLREFVKQNGPLDVGLAVKLMMHVLRGLAHAHEHDIVHRDVKPANLLLDRPKNALRVKVADFGLTRAFDNHQLNGPTLTTDGGGTPAFMPPEQATHLRDAKAAADQYSAAASLYYLLTGGQLVLDLASNELERFMQITQDKRVPIRERRRDVPAGLEKVIMKALSLDPNRRYPNVTALKEALKSYA